MNNLTLTALIMGALNPVHTAAKTTPLILMSTKLKPPSTTGQRNPRETANNHTRTNYATPLPKCYDTFGHALLCVPKCYNTFGHALCVLKHVKSNRSMA